MKNTKELTIGVTPSDSRHATVLQEILDHQGVISEIVAEPTSKLYPVVLTTDNNDGSIATASRSCVSDDNVIVVEKWIDLDKIGQFLSGETSIPTDQFALFVNSEEEKLVSRIRSRFDELDLPLIRKSFWPNNAKACCVVTHDIDWFQYSPLHKAVLKGNLRIDRIIRLILANLVRQKNYGWNIPEILEMEEKTISKSTFLFKTIYPERDSGLFAESLRLLNKRKAFELALHASHLSHRDEQALDSELAIFREKIGGNPEGLRYHTLKFVVPQSWKMEVAKNIRYDATFSYNENFGFRSEVCFPYHPIVGNQTLEVLELPTCFMDWTMLRRGIRRRKAESMYHRLKQCVEKYSGVLVVNFHNTYLNRETFPDVYALFNLILTEVRSENYWIATAAECARWWEQRASFSPKVRMTSDREITAIRSPVELVVSNSKRYTIKYQ